MSIGRGKKKLSEFNSIEFTFPREKKKLIQILLNSSKLETQCVTFYIDVFNIYNHKSFEEAMKDKAEGNIESIKWWPRLDMNIHFASVIRVTHNIITIYTS